MEKKTATGLTNKSIYDPVSVLPKVGPKRVEALNGLGIETVLDLLTHYPFRYEDLGVKKIEEIEDKEKVVLSGTVLSDPVINHFAPRKNRLSFRIVSDNVVVPVTFFNQPYLKEKVQAGEETSIFGKWDGIRKSLNGIRIIGYSTQDYESVYHTSKHIKQGTIVRLIKEALKEYADLIPEYVPSYLKKRYQLVSHKEAVRMIHFPETEEESRQAEREIIFEELFLYQLKIQWLRKKNRKPGEGILVDYDVNRLRTFLSGLPFELTGAQKRVINEICRDLKQPIQMHRLLQGDVGSGKTIVAAAAIVAAWTAGWQSALMAPTEILAEQHMESLSELFSDMDLRVALLTGSTKTAERRDILAGLQSGEIDAIIGTHALIQDDVEFHRLGLVITDEQHRFGVNQRKILREKGATPDVLFMTATPIPRTLAISAFGEMDVSTLDEMPAGRKPVKTYWVRHKHAERIEKFARDHVREGSQVYIISPLIEESETLDLKTATETYAHYQHLFEPEYKVGLLHGRMSAQEKEDIMHAFKQNEIQILVSTTVIEVGVNVPNASLMVVYDADRFGLAQLHQLRGRVGRGHKESYCVLIADPKGETGAQRMELMTQINDGFLLSEKDLEMRGPGDVFGNKQSGIPEFKRADLVEDFNALEAARSEAQQLLSQDEFLTHPQFEELRHYLGISRKKRNVFD
ncbi:ATP-dependent DNA helicase RecG [Atopococcus tabaci]|uniref:ATP-dependent DNA helicase RecG n=1 Tax=Atopococcus tabaci TaxID=269774 RepID=UPI00240A145D|nr:ATP-dependent DNA helicase RecG [Atopococcus tabaci]